MNRTITQDIKITDAETTVTCLADFSGLFDQFAALQVGEVAPFQGSGQVERVDAETLLLSAGQSVLRVRRDSAERVSGAVTLHAGTGVMLSEGSA